MTKKIINVFLIIGLMVYGFVLRIWGLDQNYSFWTDENHVAIFARAILDRGQPMLANGYTTGYYQILLYWITALSMKLFGISEFSTRLPSVLFGIVTIGAVYLLGKEVFNRKVGLLSALLIALLQIEILWSRQARPYQALQLFFLLGAYFVYRISQNIGSIKVNGFCFGLCVFFASGFHGLGLVILVSGAGYLCLMNINKNYRFLLLGGLAIIVSDLVFGWHSWIFGNLFKQNNLFYYRVFLTHNYLSICIFTFVGLLNLLLKKDLPRLLFLALFLLPQLFIVAYVLPQPFLRYFYIVFPFIIITAVLGFTESIKLLTNKVNFKPIWLARSIIVVAITLTMFIPLLLQKKILWQPTSVYSLNPDMQEIPEVDWKKIYHFVGDKLAKDSNIILITNWNDQPIWYFGEEFKDRFIMIREPNKLMDKIDAYGEKIIYSIQELENIKKSYTKGLIIADSWDNKLPEGYLEYLRSNFQPIMELDRLYSVQPRYWTVWVYGWGIGVQ